MLLSVIIPTYNSQDTIIRAISSCIFESDEIELLIVDDGSTDNTINVINQNYNNKIRSGYIRIFKTNHLGAGNARNEGIKYANGKWIIFLDSDDEFIKLKSVFLDIKALRKNSFIDVINYSNNNLTTYIVDGRKLLKDNLGLVNDEDRIWDSGPVYKVFNSSFLKDNEIVFPTNIKIGEDLVFNLNCLLLSNNILMKKGQIYEIHENFNSITHLIIKQDILNDTVSLVNRIIEFNIPKYLKELFIAKNFIAMLVRFLKSELNVEIIMLLLKRYKKEFPLRKSFKYFFDLRYSLGILKVLVSWLIWTNPRILRKIFYIMKRIKYS